MHEIFLSLYTASWQRSHFTLAEGLHSAGESFLAVSPGSIGCVASPALTSFWAELQQHLTNLTLGLCPGKGNAQLGSLGTLTALKILSINKGRHHPQNPRRDLSGEKIALKLPNLACLSVSELQDGEFVLSCPKLEVAWCFNCKSIQVTLLEDDELGFLMLQDCIQVQVAGGRPEAQFCKLKDLAVSGCTELGRPIIQDISRMQHLERLLYTGFYTACLPTSFPQSLQSISLSPLDRHYLPRGLKDLTNLTELTIKCNGMSWDINVPLAEVLPMNSLEQLTLGSYTYVREDSGGKNTFKMV